MSSNSSIWYAPPDPWSSLVLERNNFREVPLGANEFEKLLSACARVPTVGFTVEEPLGDALGYVNFVVDRLVDIATDPPGFVEGGTVEMIWLPRGKYADATLSG
jgi:hypothetical protein